MLCLHRFAALNALAHALSPLGHDLLCGTEILAGLIEPNQCIGSLQFAGLEFLVHRCELFGGGLRFGREFGQPYLIALDRVAMVGDGINDAPAMASAVGVAVSSGTDFARETAAVLLLEPDLGAVADLVQAARRMRRVTIGNLAWAGLYNAVALPAAVLGLLNPVLAAAAMVGSGLAVTVNALRLRSAGSAPGLP